VQSPDTWERDLPVADRSTPLNLDCVVRAIIQSARSILNSTRASERDIRDILREEYDGPVESPLRTAKENDEHECIGTW